MWLIVCGSHTRHSYMREKLAKGEITNEQMLQYLGIKPNKNKEKALNKFYDFINI